MKGGSFFSGRNVCKLERNAYNNPEADRIWGCILGKPSGSKQRATTSKIAQNPEKVDPNHGLLAFQGRDSVSGPFPRTYSIYSRRAPTKQTLAGNIIQRRAHLEGQVAQNQRLLYLKVAHNVPKISQNYRPQAFLVGSLSLYSESSYAH